MNLNTRNILIAICFFGPSTYGQTMVKRPHYLTKGVMADQVSARIGVVCPNIKFEYLNNGRRLRTSIEDLKGKAILFDFGNIHCSSCVTGLLSLDSLQTKFSSKISIFWVTIDEQSDIEKFLKTNPIGPKIRNISIVPKDTALARYFKHLFIPHEAWIDKFGVAKAFTTPEYVDSTHIERLIRGEVGNWPIKKEEDFNLDSGFTSLNTQNFKTIDLPAKFFYSSFATHLENNFLTSFYITGDTVNNTSTLHALNYSIRDMYKMVLGTSNIKELHLRSHLIFDVKDYSLYEFPGSGYIDDWKRVHTYCYEIKYSNRNSIDVRNRHIFSDLDYYFGLTSMLVDTVIDCWKIVDGKGKITLSKDDTAHKLSIDDLLDIMNNYVKGGPPVIASEELLKMRKSEFKFENDDNLMINNYDHLKSLFIKFGFDLVKAKYKTKVFVVQDLR